MAQACDGSDREAADARSGHAAADREALRTATFEQCGGSGFRFAKLHPCETRRLEWGVTAKCMGCLADRWIDLEFLLRGPLAHAPWPRVMRSLTCRKCGSCAGALMFSRANFNGVGRFEIGRLLVRTDQP